MAKTTQEKKTFKWGDNEYLLDDLLKLHSEQEHHYYNFARDRGQYDDAALAGLRTAINNRIQAVKDGKTFEGDGVLDSDTADNTRIKTQKKGLFKKAKYVEQDNTEWAKYYLSKLVGQLTPHTKTASVDKGSWDLTKHGLGAYLTGQGYNAKDIFEQYDLRDEDNPDAARSYAQRRKLLKDQLAGYKTWLGGKGFDFTKNDNEWDDNFINDLNDLVTNFDSLDNKTLTARLRKIGAGDAYTTAFTSDRWDLSKSSEETTADQKRKAAEKKAKEEKEAFAKFAKNTYGAYAGLADNNLGGTYFTTKGDGLFDMSDTEYESWLNTHTNDRDAYMKNLQDKYYANPFDASVAGEYLPLAARFGALKEVNIDGKAWYYDPRTIDRKNNRLVVFDKETGEMKHTFLGDVADEWNAIRRKWRIDNGYEDPAERYTAYNEQGGVLSMQTGGGFNLVQAVNRDLENRNKARAEETGNTEEIQKARDRVISNGDRSFVSEKTSIAQPDAGFSGADIARLVSIGADITSIFLDPVTGVAVGLGSTLTNFGADIADDGFQWEDVKNLGINVGFDLLGAIPIFGDAFGTGAKITKNLVKWAPRIMTGMAAFQGVRNFDGMMNSLSKFLSEDKDKKLTVQDWRNIAQSISLVTGGARAIKNKAQQSKMRKEARVDGVLGVNIRNKNGDVEQILVDGKTADQIRNAKGDSAEITKILNDLDAYKGKFGENGDYVVSTKNDGSWQSPIHRRELQDGSGKKEWEYRGFKQSGKADVNEVYDFSKVTTGYGSGWGLKIPGVSDQLNRWHQNLVAKANSKMTPAQVDQRGKLTGEAFEAEHTKLLTDNNVEAQVGKIKAAVEARRKSLAKTDEFITKTQAEVEGLQKSAGGDDFDVRYADAEARLRGLSSNDVINAAQNTIAHNTAVIARNKAKRSVLSQSRASQLSQVDSKVKQIQSRMTDISESLTAGRKRIMEIDVELSKRISKAKRTALTAERAQIVKDNRSLAKEHRVLSSELPQAQAVADAGRTRIIENFNRAYTRLAASTKTSKGAIATATPIAAQRKAYSEAYAQREAATAGREAQKRLNTLLGRKAAHDPATAHTHAYKELEILLNNLKASNPTIGGRTVNWDMDAILKRYGVDAKDVFKQGGSINRNKINKFLTYAKG